LPYYLLKKIPIVGSFISRIDQSIFIEGASITMYGNENSYRDPISKSETKINLADKTFYFSSGISLSLPAVWSEHRLSLDFPLYLNKPLAGEKEFDFRFSIAWILPTDF